MATNDKNDKPSFYLKVSEQYPEVIASVERLGATLRTAGPLEGRTTQLIQLAAAAAMQSEGSVCSHTRRALKAGATPDEIRHTLLLLMATMGFPRAMAALSWAEEELAKESNKE